MNVKHVKVNTDYHLICFCLEKSVPLFGPSLPACSGFSDHQEFRSDLSVVVPKLLILDAYPAHERSILCYFICLRHLIKWREIKNEIFSPIWLHSCKTFSELPFDISTMVCTMISWYLGIQRLVDTIIFMYKKSTIPANGCILFEHVFANAL